MLKLCHVDDLYATLIFGIYVFQLQNELDNLSTRLEECFLQYTMEWTQPSAQICVTSVAKETDTCKEDVELDSYHCKSRCRCMQNLLFKCGECFF